MIAHIHQKSVYDSTRKSEIRFMNLYLKTYIDLNPLDFDLNSLDFDF